MAHRVLINDCNNCNEKSICEVQELMNNYGFRCKIFTPHNPLTNADRINVMTNEEKASFLALIELRFASKRDITTELDKSYDKWLDWLKQEVDDD